jgi:hypothetical protein
LFKVLVEACKNFSDKYAIIVSTGDEKTYQKYANTPLNSDQILMVPHTPQVEILKRAHLFITHAGMNSVSEAVNYGVPVICLPLSGDQPFVAWRVADELNLGIRLQPDDTLTVGRVSDAIRTILKDPGYRTRAQKYSAISKKFSGHFEACNLTVKLIQEHETKKKTFQFIGEPPVDAIDDNFSLTTNLIKSVEPGNNQQSNEDECSVMMKNSERLSASKKMTYQDDIKSSKKHKKFSFSFGKKK